MGGHTFVFSMYQKWSRVLTPTAPASMRMFQIRTVGNHVRPAYIILGVEM